MNIDYIMYHMATRHHTNVRCFNSQFQPVSTVNKLSGMQDWLAFNPDSITEFFDKNSKDIPLVTSVDNNWYYITIPTPAVYYIIGPVTFFSKIIAKHKLTPNCTNIGYNEVPVLEFYNIMQDTLLFRNLFYDKVITDVEFLNHNCEQRINNVEKNYYDLLFENRENNKAHNSYEQEMRMLSSIENGNLELLAKCREEEIIGDFGVMAPASDRSVRNVCISAITLISRAAIRGGLNPELAFSLCDSYVVEIEQVQNLLELQTLVESAKTKFATMVRDLKSHKDEDCILSWHPLVNKCKDYVYRHLHEHITLKSIAESLNTNKNYLSMLFKQYEGISFHDFLMEEKIKLTKNMLIYSTFSLSDISLQLGFSSQSHLNSIFVNSTGMTLKQYRDKFRSSN